jgi:hypothetical protein
LSIRKGNIEMHKDWMIKSYVLTLSFITFRFAEDLLTRAGVSDFVGRKVLMAWGCWAIPFFITVLVLQVRRLFRKAPASLLMTQPLSPATGSERSRDLKMGAVN